MTESSNFQAVISVVVIRNFDTGANDVSGCTRIEPTTLRNGMMSENSAHLCANYRAYDDGFFSQVQFALDQYSLNVTISRQTSLRSH